MRESPSDYGARELPFHRAGRRRGGTRFAPRHRGLARVGGMRAGDAAPALSWVGASTAIGVGRQGGGADADQANAIAVDSLGNSFVTGGFGGSATFGGVLLTNRNADLLRARCFTAWTVETIRKLN